MEEGKKVAADNGGAAGNSGAREAAQEPAAQGNPGALSRVAILDELKNVMDPELMLNVVDLGLVYSVETTEDSVEIVFSLTYPGCPAGENIQQDIQRNVEEFTGLDSVTVKLVWDPPWEPGFMSEEARVTLGYPI